MLPNVELIQEVVIVGGGPVGNLCAVLTSFIGAKTVVYEKRQTYTRQINLKIQLELFQNISRIFQNISRRSDPFFSNMHKTLQQKDGKILLKTLQQTLKQKAQQFGATYKIKQIKTFEQVYKIHENNNPIIIDCTGRNSFLRVNQFGNDQSNMKIYDLHHALHVNFDSTAVREFDYRLMYSIITNTEDVSLGDIVVSKGKGKGEGGEGGNKSVHVTIPLFISNKLSKLFDENYPNINRSPLKPFSSKKEDCIIQQDVQNLLYSIFCPFVMQDWDINWNSVLVKKINITCGYAINRSKNRYVCLGDSAAHFAYFKSLNFGLKHAFQLVKVLASYHGFKCKLPQFNQKQAIDLCKSFYPPLIITQAKPGPAPSQYFIKTDAIVYSALVFNTASQSIKKLDILPVFCVQKIPRLFNEYVQDSVEISWQKHLDRFEKERQNDIDLMILSNKSKRNATEIISHLIWLDGLNPMKFADFLNIVTKGFALDKKDLDFFARVLKTLKKNIEDKPQFTNQLNKTTKQLKNTVSSTIPKQFHTFCEQLIKLTQSQQYTMQQFLKLIDNMKWNRNYYDYKWGTLYIKILGIVAQVYRNSQGQGQGQGGKKSM